MGVEKEATKTPGGGGGNSGIESGGEVISRAIPHQLSVEQRKILWDRQVHRGRFLPITKIIFAAESKIGEIFSGKMLILRM